MGTNRTSRWSIVVVSSSLLLPVAVGVAGAASLTFEDRVDAQRALDRVRYSHQTGARRPFEEAVSSESTRGRVQAYLEKSAALERLWNTPVTAAMLTNEVDRMVRHSRFPDRLEELFAALDHDPLLLRECLARPALVNRLTRGFFDQDRRIHAEPRRKAEAIRDDLLAGRIDPFVEHPLRRVVTFARERIPDGAGAPIGDIVLPAAEFDLVAARLSASGGVSLEQEVGAFVIRGRLAHEGTGTLTIARYEVPKRRWDAWWPEVRPALDPRSVVVPPGADVPLNGDTGRSVVLCEPDDTWLDGSMNAPPAMAGHSAVWTGDRMIVWGGGIGTGFLYDPATDTWTPISFENAPAGRHGHTAIWTGEEMIVWGGSDGGASLATGGRYNPVTNTWSATSTVDAPDQREDHTAVWTGREMIVWGGYYDANVDCGAVASPECGWSNCCVANGTPGCTDSVCEQIICGLDPYCCDVLWDEICADEASEEPDCVEACGYGPIHYSSGGRYDPATDSWTPTATEGGPSARRLHAAVWTGTEMIVWGGSPVGFVSETGGRYDPETDSWMPLSIVDCPSPRADHTAVWTGTEMIVWGGSADASDLASGGRYDPVADSWSPTSTFDCPAARSGHTAVWTGSEMIVWGGSGLDTGGHYDPASDLWTPTATDNAPEGRSDHTAVWTGGSMVVWGGYLGYPENTGGRYDPVKRGWTPTATSGGPSPRRHHTAVWTGTEMIVWGGTAGATGGRYDPALDSWADMSTSGGPQEGGAVWTGNRMIVWRDEQGGGLYDPWNDAWTAVGLTNAPQAVSDFSLVWTGTEMIVWGGRDESSNDTATGGRYDPITDGWTPTSTVNAPEARHFQSSVWTGSEMIVWGGESCTWTCDEIDSGGRYDPSEDSWNPTAAENAPDPRERHTAVWTGEEMIVWGGRHGSTAMNTGGRYEPSRDSWSATSLVDVPESRTDHTAVWTGSRMIVWSGDPWDLPSGGLYAPAHDRWTPTSLDGAPQSRREHSAVWTGGLMIVWGGWAGTGEVGNGGVYAYGHATDDDGDGFSECDGDCDDSRPDCFSDCGDLDADTFCGDADCDDSRAECSLDCSDKDADSYCADADCSPGNPDTYPGAEEVNDGLDNQCPGDPGYGVTDETSGVSGFLDPLDSDVYSWPAQSGATLYEVARASRADFSIGCTSVITGDVQWVDVTLPAVEECFFYLNRPLEPHEGSWGQDSFGVERTGICPP